MVPALFAVLHYCKVETNSLQKSAVESMNNSCKKSEKSFDRSVEIE